MTKPMEYSSERPDGKGGFDSTPIPRDAVDLITKSMAGGAGPEATCRVVNAVHGLDLSPTAVKMIYFQDSGQLDIDKGENADEAP